MTTIDIVITILAIGIIYFLIDIRKQYSKKNKLNKNQW